MKNFLFTCLLALFGTALFAQSPVGTWKTVDDNTGQDKSYVEIYKKSDGSLEGKVIKILTKGKENAKCENCKGSKHNQPVTGMVIMEGLKKSGDKWKGGQILDPENGKVYKCQISLKDENTLDVRGFIGFSLIGRTQTWHRIK